MKTKVPGSGQQGEAGGGRRGSEVGKFHMGERSTEKAASPTMGCRLARTFLPFRDGVEDLDFLLGFIPKGGVRRGWGAVQEPHGGIRRVSSQLYFPICYFIMFRSGELFPLQLQIVLS